LILDAESLCKISANLVEVRAERDLLLKDQKAIQDFESKKGERWYVYKLTISRSFSLSDLKKTVECDANLQNQREPQLDLPVLLP